MTLPAPLVAFVEFGKSFSKYIRISDVEDTVIVKYETRYDTPADERPERVVAETDSTCLCNDGYA